MSADLRTRAASWWLAPLLVLALPAFGQDDAPDVQRYLENLYLGDTLEDVQRIYPPAQEWPSSIEPRSRVTRFRVERGAAKSFPPSVQTMWLGLRRGRLVEIQFIYDARFSRRKSAETLADDLALVYGDPRRSNEKFWWSDGRTVLRVFNAELPVAGAAAGPDAASVAMRTSIQILERSLFRPRDD